MPTALFVVTLIVLAMFSVAVFNGLLARRAKLEAAWVYLSRTLGRRRDLVAVLVATVRPHLGRSSAILENVAQARTDAAAAFDLQDVAAAESLLARQVSTLLAAVDGHAGLAADPNVSAVMAELAVADREVAAARQAYNAAVRSYDTARAQGPGAVFASLFGFEDHDYYPSDSNAKRTTS